MKALSPHVNARICLSVFKTMIRVLKTTKRGQWPEIVDDEVLKTSIELDPCQNNMRACRTIQLHSRHYKSHLHAIKKAKCCGKWVPHQLSDTSKIAQVNIVGILLRSAKISEFFCSLITLNGKWICYNNIRGK